MRLILCTLAALTAVSGVAHASSPDAWADLRKRSDKACIAASQLKAARITGYVDTFEKVAVSTVEGTWPQKHMKGAKAKFVCVFDKQTGKAEAQELQP
jgi:hypothetical protein